MNNYATVYKIINSVNSKVYYGITKRPPNYRWNSHKYFSTRRNTPLYTAMRKYGLDKFSLVPIVYCTWDYACFLEKRIIASFENLYNLAPGGEGGFNVKDKVSWRKKLSVARRKNNHKPFFGRKHSNETKLKCAEASKLRWARAKSNDLS